MSWSVTCSPGSKASSSPDEETTRKLESFYKHAAGDRARTFVVDFDALDAPAPT
jgi:hypothetical protein